MVCFLGTARAAARSRGAETATTRHLQMAELSARETTVRPPPAPAPTSPRPPATRTVSSGAAGLTGEQGRPAVPSVSPSRRGPAPTRSLTTSRRVRATLLCPHPALADCAAPAPPPERSSLRTFQITIQVHFSSSVSFYLMTF